MRFSDMPDMVRGFLFVWLICIFILGLCNLFHSVQVKQTRHIVISVVLLVVEYFLLQITSDILHRRAGMESVRLSDALGRIHVIWWIVLIAGMMFVSITLAFFFRRWKEEHITPMSVKDSIDRLHAGLCYWEDGGRIILSNKKMDEICFAFSGEMLLNGEKFYKSLESECVILPDGTIKYFFDNEVEFEDKQIHELIAADVTELYKKNELLEQEMLSLRKMNESLRRYNQNLEDMVRMQEILDAKVYIHDEMNRLMLVTTAMTETSISDEEFRDVLTLWRNNVVLLGNETEKNRTDVDISEIDGLAALLGINVIWTGTPLREAPKKIREVLVMIAREAIANAVKHAEAKNVAIDMATANKEMTITITNDGKRPEGKINIGGGLSNIRRIVEAQNGKLEVMVKEQFVLSIKIPC